MDKELLKQLKSLNKIQPSTKWKNSTREDILAQIMSENSPQKMGLWAEFLYFIKFSGRMFNDFAMKPIGTMVLVAFLVLGGGVLKVEADNSMPGDLLYSLKRGSEIMQVAFAFDSEKKLAARLEIIDERAREINIIASTAIKNREARTKIALANFHRDFTPVKDDLASSNNKVSSVAIARNIEDKTNELQFMLTMAQNKSDDNLNNDINKIIKDVNNTNINALEVLANDSDGKQIIQKINDKIDEATIKVNKNSNTPSDALAKLDEAKKELENNNFVVALEKIKESNELIDNDNATTIPVIDLETVKSDATSTVWLIGENSTSSCDSLDCSSTPDTK